MIIEIIQINILQRFIFSTISRGSFTDVILLLNESYLWQL